MSKLNYDEQPEQSFSDPAAGELPSAVVIGHLKACQQLSQEHLAKAFDIYLKALFEAYDIEINAAKSDKLSTELMGLQRLIKKNAADLRHYFTGYFAEGFVKFSRHKLNTSIESIVEVGSESSLSIVDNEILDESIAISSMTRRVEGYYADVVAALNQRFSALNNGEPVTEASNPCSPIQYCDALRRALKTIDMNANAKLIAYKVFDLQFLSLFGLVSEEINTYLSHQGILKNITLNHPKAAAPASELVDDSDAFAKPQAPSPVTALPGSGSGSGAAHSAPAENVLGSEPVSSEAYQTDLVSAIRSLHQQVSGGGHSTANHVYSAKQILGALGGVQNTGVSASHIVNTPAGVLEPFDVANIVSELKASLERSDADGEVKKDDMQTINLVGMVFEYMLNDENIPDSVKTLLSYLHTPFLKVAFIDPGFFERTEHPARVLLNNLADAGAKWVSNDGSSQFEMYDQIKEVVNRVLSDFDKDIKVITALLFEFNHYVKKVSRKQELTERRAKEKAEGEDKLREMKLKVNDVVRDRIRGKDLPSAVLLLLLQPWSDYLTFTLLRFGEESEGWRAGVGIVDDVLWCIEPKLSAEDKNKLKPELKRITECLKQGFAVIGFDGSKGTKLLNTFVSLCKLALQNKAVEPAPAPMRNEIERIAAEKAGKHIHENEEVSAEEAQMVESLKMIEFGTWFEFSGGKRLKVAWYNGRTSHYMLVDQMGKRVDMESGLAMARKMISGEVKIISGSSKPFFERALENIYQKLNEKAESTAGVQNAQ